MFLYYFIFQCLSKLHQLILTTLPTLEVYVRSSSIILQFLLSLSGLLFLPEQASAEVLFQLLSLFCTR